MKFAISFCLSRHKLILNQLKKINRKQSAFLDYYYREIAPKLFTIFKEFLTGYFKANEVETEKHRRQLVLVHLQKSLPRVKTMGRVRYYIVQKTISIQTRYIFFLNFVLNVFLSLISYDSNFQLHFNHYLHKIPYCACATSKTSFEST